MVSPGQAVEPETVIARAMIPGLEHEIGVSSALGVAPEDLGACMVKREGDRVEAGEALAASRGFMGLVSYVVPSPVSGVVETISPVTGTVVVRGAPRSLDLVAGIAGVVAETLPGRGAIVESEGVLVRGVHSVGGPAYGKLLAPPPGEGSIHPGYIVVQDQLEEGTTGRGRTVDVGAAAPTCVVAGSASYRSLLRLGARCAVLITGGFGRWGAGDRIVRMLAGLGGRWAAVNGASFPCSLFVPAVAGSPLPPIEKCLRAFRPRGAGEPPREGDRVVITAGPAAGHAAEVLDVLPGFTMMPSGTFARAAEVRLGDGSTAVVPLQNLEFAAPLAEVD
jgi:hypothetical protein